MAAGIWFMYGVIILIVTIVLKVVMKKQAIATRLTFIIFLFLMITVGYVYTATDSKVGSFDDFSHFLGTYFSWLFSLFHNAKEVTSNAINQDWGANRTYSG